MVKKIGPVDGKRHDRVKKAEENKIRRLAESMSPEEIAENLDRDKRTIRRKIKESRNAPDATNPVESQNQEYSERARTHDEGVFKESDVILDERKVKQITVLLEVGSMPKDEIFYGMAKYIEYFSLVKNRYLNIELNESCNQVIDKLTKTVEFVARNSDERNPGRMLPEGVLYGVEYSPEARVATQRCLEAARGLADELRKAYAEYIDKVMSIITPSK